MDFDESKINSEGLSKTKHEAGPRPVSGVSASRAGTRLSIIGPEELSVFRPMEESLMTTLDTGPALRRESWFQSFRSDRVASIPFAARRASTRTPNTQFEYSYVGTESKLRTHLSHRTNSEPQLGLMRSEPEHPTGIRLLIMMAALVFSIFLIALDMETIPAITNEFKGLQDVAWYGAVFFTTAAGFQSTWGKTYRFFPLKMSFLTAIVIFEVGSLICGLAPTSLSFIIGRAIAGIGAAGVGSGSYTIAAFIAPPKKRAAYTGLLGAVYGVASVIGPLLGGVFSGTSTWRWCFYINLPIGLLPVGTILFLFHAPQSAKPQEVSWKEKLLQMDPLGTILMMGAIITFLMAVNYGGQSYPWSSPMVVGLLVGSGLLSIVFGICECWQGERAMVIPRLFRRDVIGLSSLYSIMQSGGFYIMIYYLPIYFQAIRGNDPVISGVENLPFILAAMLGALSAGIFISTTGLSTVVMIGGAATGALGCGLCVGLDGNSPPGFWIASQAVAGLGLGGAMQIPVIVSQASVEAVDLSSTTAMILCFQTLGGAVWLSAAQSAFVNKLLRDVPVLAPAVDPLRVVATGAGQLRSAFMADELVGVLAAYLDGIHTTFILSCTIVGAAFLLGLLQPWKRLDVVAMQKNAGGA